ncbi:phosphinothricin acetyltransferase, partial [Microbacterium sp. SUBG005]
MEDIYRDGIEDGNATFETEPPTWDAFDQAKARFGRLVAVDDAHAVV